MQDCHLRFWHSANNLQQKQCATAFVIHLSGFHLCIVKPKLKLLQWPITRNAIENRNELMRS